MLDIVYAIIITQVPEEIELKLFTPSYYLCDNSKTNNICKKD